MTLKIRIIPILIILILFSCKTKTTDNISRPVSVPVFDPDFSEPAAVQLADSIASAAGGFHAWNDVRALSWSFNAWNFTWDKVSGRVRAKSSERDFVCLFGTATHDAKMKMNGTEVTDKSTINQRLDSVRLAFRESAQILTMPFNLKAPGAKLIYEGEQEDGGVKYNILEGSNEKDSSVYFDHFQLLVALDDNLIKRCNCVRNGDSLAISFEKYSKYGKILLSDGYVKNVKIEEDLPDSFFSDL
ncbi:MAG TPA: hypothetical protein VGK59_14030 [Ohtaekwangia sp.]